LPDSLVVVVDDVELEKPAHNDHCNEDPFV
jgi:hypothetical protein